MDDLEAADDSIDHSRPLEAADSQHSGESPNEQSAAAVLLPAILAVVVGIVVGLGLAIWWGGRSDEAVQPTSTLVASVPVTESPEDAEARLADAAEFLNAWRRWRGAEAYVRYDVTRERGGEQFTSDALLVQQVPNRMIAEFGSLSGLSNGREVNCDYATGERICDPDSESMDYQALLDSELAAIRSTLASEPPAYRATLVDGCWRLVLVNDVSTQFFGTQGELCFAADTGILERARYEFADGLVETRQSTTIRTTVTGDDFEEVVEQIFD